MSPRDFQIRHAAPSDAEQWRRLRLALWPDEASDHAGEIARFFEESRGQPGRDPEAVLVAVAPDEARRLLGFAELSRRAYAEGCDTSPVGFLEGWYVVPERRREGIGRALVDAAERWAQALGCREFASDALAENRVSADAHAALGFEEVGLIRCFRKDLPRGPDSGPRG